MIATTHPLDGSPYQAYAYSYPHKSAYRALDPPVPLEGLWAAEPRDALFLYIHVPFCGMRCGFCNLFTRAGADPALVTRYLDALGRQAGRVRDAVGAATYAGFALGGGTPTYLDADGLRRVLDAATHTMGAGLGAIPASVEVSPDTVDAEKLGVLVGRGIDRVSIGVETFDESEAASVQRPQKAEAVARALGLIRDSGVPTLNVDLIYGLPRQTVASWLGSVRSALDFRPEELYLYPLYVRPLTGLGRSGRSWDDLRLACYREARGVLLGEGYEQVSMRMFRLAGRSGVGSDDPAGAHRCQEDGMVGLGSGARSYTRGLHYSGEYAVGAKGVRAIIDDYAARPAGAFGVADYGVRLGPDDQRRRFVIQSILQRPGLSLGAYARRFGTDALDDLPSLAVLESRGLAARAGGVLVLTGPGLERSDAVGPFLYSDEVRRSMEGHPWR